VNGEAITLAEYQAELARYQAAVGTQLAPEEEQQVLDDLVDELLLAQAAAENGFTAGDAPVQDRYRQLADRMGGEQALKDWMAQNGFLEAEFRSRLASGIAAAWMRDQILAGVPENAEQVHARQILLYNSEEAQSALAELQAGADFGDLALQYDPATGGDLGWFPRGFLLDTGLEAAAFALQPGEITSVVQTTAGFHILQVLEKEPQYPLTPNARLALQRVALDEWLTNRRNQSNIQVMLP
jgi:peptidyl-prolyl cis-trans isomerase C